MCYFKSSLKTAVSKFLFLTFLEIQQDQEKYGWLHKLEEYILL